MHTITNLDLLVELHRNVKGGTHVIRKHHLIIDDDKKLNDQKMAKVATEI